MKVLVVEDSRTQALRLRADLEDQGFDVLVAFNGRQGLQEAARERPDVILSDVLMPDFDGFRLCRELQLDPELSHIPVVLRSAAFLDEEDRNLALSLGASAYIEKGVEGGDLARVLHAARTDDRVPGSLGSLAESDFGGTYAGRLLSHLVEQAAHAERVSDDLRQTQQLLQAVMDNSPALIWVKDLGGRLVMVNDQFRKVFGPSEDVIGKAASALFIREDQEDYAQQLGEAIASGMALESEETIHLDDGAHSYLSTKYPLKNEDGEVYAVCGIALDITERKLLEERLRRVEKMEVIGRLSGGIAHDFNNLLSVIINYATFVLEELDDPDQASKDVGEVVQAAQRGTQLVQQLLTFSRGGSVSVESVDVNQTIANAEGLLRGLLDAETRMVVGLDPDLPPITINPDQLGQVLLNLVVNARDSMPAGGRVSVTTALVRFDHTLTAPSCELAAGDYVRVTVADTGTGMTKDTMQRIFDPFFTTKAEGVGTGLGLSTVHGIVTGAGGGVVVDSELGAGTTFHIYLPVGDEDEQQEVSAEGKSPVADRATEVRYGPILLVDDEEGIRETLARTLMEEGYEVLLAGSGAEAIDLFGRESRRIALLITDITMPGMKGRDLAVRLRAASPDLRVLYISGSVGAKDDPKLFSEGLFLPKPFTPTELLAKVRDAIGESRAPGPSRD